MRGSGGIISKFANFANFARGNKSGKKPILRKLGMGGVTLLELFIVIEIIGFLATILLSNFYRSKKAAEVTVYVQNVKNVQTALASYYAMEDKFPASLNTIWLQFYGGRVINNFEYIGGTTADNQGGWSFFASNSVDIKFNGPTNDQYALRTTENLLPYARYVYGDPVTFSKIVH